MEEQARYGALHRKAQLETKIAKLQEVMEDLNKDLIYPDPETGQTWKPSPSQQEAIDKLAEQGRGYLEELKKVKRILGQLP